jgi:hypothetical protein
MQDLSEPLDGFRESRGTERDDIYSFQFHHSSPENENIARRAPPGRNEAAHPHQLVAKAVPGPQTMGGALYRDFEDAVLEIKMVFQTEARRKRIVDGRASRQFAAEHLTFEVERQRRDGAPTEAGGRIDPLSLVGPPNKRWRVALNIGEQARYGCAMRSGEPSEHGGGWAHLAILDPRQRRAAHSAQLGKFIQRPAARAPQRAQALSEAHVGRVQGRSFHMWENNLKNENVNRYPANDTVSFSANGEGLWSAGGYRIPS